MADAGIGILTLVGLQAQFSRGPARPRDRILRVIAALVLIAVTLASLRWLRPAPTHPAKDPP